MNVPQPKENLASRIDFDPAQGGPITRAVTTMQPTKFGKLLKVVWPLAQGALVGGFGGNWRQPGSGFEAQQQFSGRRQEVGLQQQDLALRREMLQRQYAADQYRNALDAARAREAESRADREDRMVENQGKLATRPQIEDTDAGLMSVDPETAQARPITNMAPEETGSLPLTGQGMPELHKYQKPIAPQRPTVVGEGQELVDPTGKVITPARPKTFAPRKPSAADTKNATQGKAETYADALLKQFGGDADKALAAVEGLKSLDPSLKAEVRKLIRDVTKPSPKRKFAPSPEQMQKLSQAPAS